jgi:hypothetical protein
MPAAFDCERYEVKGGWAARCPTLRIAAHGTTPEEAEGELTYLVLLLRSRLRDETWQRATNRAAAIAELEKAVRGGGGG